MGHGNTCSSLERILSRRQDKDDGTIRFHCSMRFEEFRLLSRFPPFHVSCFPRLNMAAVCWGPWPPQGEPTDLTPCGEVVSAGQAVPCCGLGDICLSDNICSFTHSQTGVSGYYTAGCTDGSFSSPCARRCCTSSINFSSFRVQLRFVNLQLTSPGQMLRLTLQQLPPGTAVELIAMGQPLVETQRTKVSMLHRQVFSQPTLLLGQPPSHQLSPLICRRCQARRFLLQYLRYTVAQPSYLRHQQS